MYTTAQDIYLAMNGDICVPFTNVRYLLAFHNFMMKKMRLATIMKAEKTCFASPEYYNKCMEAINKSLDLSQAKKVEITKQ